MKQADLGKAASGACGHFYGNHAILRKFCVLLCEDEGRRVDDGELMFDKGDLR